VAFVAAELRFTVPLLVARQAGLGGKHFLAFIASQYTILAFSHHFDRFENGLVGFRHLAGGIFVGELMVLELPLGREALIAEGARELVLDFTSEMFEPFRTPLEGGPLFSWACCVHLRRLRFPFFPPFPGSL